MKEREILFFLLDDLCDLFIVFCSRRIIFFLIYRSSDLCSKHNAFGLFLISMEGNNDGLCALAKRIKITFPNLKVGVNLPA